MNMQVHTQSDTAWKTCDKQSIQGRTHVGLILWLKVEWKNTCSVTEFALWDSVTVNWGKQLIFWVKDVCNIRHIGKLLKK